MTTIQKYAIISISALALLVATFFAGRFSTPSKVITKFQTQTQTVTQIQYVDKIVTKVVYVKVKDTQQNTQTTTTVDKKPTGETVTTIVKNTETNTKTDVNQNTTTNNQVTDNTNQKTDTKTDSLTIKENSQPNWRVSALAGVDFNSLSLKTAVGGLDYKLGGSVERRLFGSLNAGVWVLFDTQHPVPEGGLSVSLGF